MAICFFMILIIIRVIRCSYNYLFNKFNFTLGCITLWTFWVQAFTLAVALASTVLAEEQIMKV